MLNLSETRDMLVIAGAALGVVALLLSFWISSRLRRLERLQNALEELGLASTDRPVIDTLTTILESSRKQARDTAEIEKTLHALAEKVRWHTQRIGVVRYNAYDNMGADLSFSAALLDATSSGLVLTGLCGREDSRVYCKPVKNGESSYLLTDEERQAIQIAAENGASTTTNRQETRLRKAK